MAFPVEGQEEANHNFLEDGFIYHAAWNADGMHLQNGDYCGIVSHEQSDVEVWLGFNDAAIQKMQSESSDIPGLASAMARAQQRPNAAGAIALQQYQEPDGTHVATFLLRMLDFDDTTGRVIRAFRKARFSVEGAGKIISVKRDLSD